MLKSVTRNVSTVGLEVRDFSPGTVANRADTYTQTHTHTTALFVLFTACFLGPLLLYALTSWCLYVTSFEVLFAYCSWR